MAYGKIKADTLVYDNSGSDVEVALSTIGNKADSASPTFTGTVTIPTPSSGDSSTKAASTAFVTAGFTAKPAAEGTVGASEVVVVDGNKDITGFRNITLSGDLTVNGTTTTINSTTLTVDDKNIELGSVDTPSDTTADGGGITLKGATDKRITWNTTQNAWLFNKDITVESGVLTVKGVEGGNANIYLFADEGDDNADNWKIQTLASDNTLIFQNKTTGSYTTTLKLNPNGALEDSKGDVRNIPINSQTSGYTLVVGDAGKVVATTTGGWTIPASVFTTVGQVVTLLNNSASDQTITASALTYLYNTADGTNIKASTITLGARGMATIWFDGGATGYIQSGFLTVS